MCLCQLFVICYLFICAHYSLFVVHLFVVHCSTIYFIIVYFHFLSILCFICWLKEKRTILILNLCSGISIPLPANHHQYESINIIQQTPPTLSQYRSEGPITTIDIAGQTKPISPHSKLQQRARQLYTTIHIFALIHTLIGELKRASWLQITYSGTKTFKPTESSLVDETYSFFCCVS